MNVFGLLVKEMSISKKTLNQGSITTIRLWLFTSAYTPRSFLKVLLTRRKISLEEETFLRTREGVTVGTPYIYLLSKIAS